MISDKQAVSGDIIINTADGLVRSNLSYQSSILGVLTSEPVAVFKADTETEKPVATGGVVVVNVTPENGEVQKGDFVTSSTSPGKGMKATSSGYVLGMAVSQTSGGKVNVAVRVEYAEINSPQTLKRLFDLLGRGIFQNVSDPDKFGTKIKTTGEVTHRVSLVVDTGIRRQTDPGYSKPEVEEAIVVEEEGTHGLLPPIVEKPKTTELEYKDTVDPVPVSHDDLEESKF